MKLKQLIVVALLALLPLTGCISPDDPNREVKIEQTKAAATVLVSSAVRRAIVKNPDTAPIFETAANVFGSLKETGEFDPLLVAPALDKALVASGALDGLNPEDRQLALDVKNFLLTIYTINYADRLRADVSEQEFLLNLADVFATAVKQALTDANL